MKKLMRMAVMAAISGCGVGMEEGEVDAESAAQRQALVTNGYATSSGGLIDLGDDGDRTCFLQGVSGELKANRGEPRAGARVYTSNGHWYLKTTPGNGAGVKAQATCVPYVVGRKYLTWSGNDSDGYSYRENKTWFPEGATTALTKCFLTEIEVTTGFASTNAHVQLRREHIWWAGSDFDTWTMGGNLTRDGDQDSGGRAKAVCLEVWNDSFWYGWTSGGNGATTTVPGTTTSGWACGINKLVGRFANDSYGGINDGVRVFPQSGVFKVFASGGKRVEGECHTNPQF